MDNTKLIAEAQGWDADAVNRHAMSALDTICRLADALETAEAALKFKQGLIEDISRDCERAEVAAPERTLTDADLDRFETTAEPLDDAWTEYRNAHPDNNSPVGYATFRAGYSRGVAQGAVIASTTFVHGAEPTVARGGAS